MLIHIAQHNLKDEYIIIVIIVLHTIIVCWIILTIMNPIALYHCMIIIGYLLSPELSMCCTPMKLPISVYPTMFSRNFESDWMSKEKVGLVCGASSQHFSINWNLRFIKEFNYDTNVKQKLSNIIILCSLHIFHVKCHKWRPAGKRP